MSFRSISSMIRGSIMGPCCRQHDVTRDWSPRLSVGYNIRLRMRVPRQSLRSAEPKDVVKEEKAKESQARMQNGDYMQM